MNHVINHKFIMQEVDIACMAFSGVANNDILDLTVFVSGYGYGILTRYPIPRTLYYGHLMIFSLNVIIQVLLLNLTKLIITILYIG